MENPLAASRPFQIRSWWSGRSARPWMSTIPVEPVFRARGTTVVRTAGVAGSSGAGVAFTGSGVGGGVAAGVGAAIGTAVGTGVARAGVGDAAGLGTGAASMAAGDGSAGVGWPDAATSAGVGGAFGRGLAAVEGTGLGAVVGMLEASGDGAVLVEATPWRDPAGGGADIRLHSQNPPPARATTPRAMGRSGGPLRSSARGRGERAGAAPAERGAGLGARTPLGSPASRSCFTTCRR